MRITVALCTRNRAASLAQALGSMAAMRRPEGLDWRLIVVDNGSTDGTPEVVAGFADRLPARCIKEPRAGLSHARNAAVAAADGDYLVWTDDDVLVDVGWIGAYAQGFARFPQAAVFTGRIIPRFEEPAVPWFRDHWRLFAHALAHRDFGDAVREFRQGGAEYPFGANYALRMAEQKAHLYAAELGTAPGRARLGEETMVVERILAAGNSGVYLPDSIVQHCIGHDRQSTAYLEKYYRAAGETQALEYAEPGGRLILGVPRWLWIRLARRRLRYAIARRTAGPETWIAALKDYAFDRGAFDYWRRHAIEEAAPRR
jgi:glycosyltransferase involved in cell wall biosynthesis